MLFEEPSNLMKQELREPQTYNDIIRVIAGGSSKMNEIVTGANIEGFDSSKCNKYLGSLISLGIVKKELPAMDIKSKKSIYRIKDGMFRFWYRFVPQNLSKIQLRQGREVYNSIEPYLSDYMGEVFEEISKEWLWRENLNGRLPVQFRDCGRWWGNNPARKEEMEIDILAFVDNEQPAIFCECKWRNEKTDVRILDELIEKSSNFNFPDKYYIIFSKSGFTKSLEKRASNKVMLIEFKNMT